MISAALEAIEFVRGAGTRGENDEAEVHFLLSQIPDQVEAVTVGQADVDDGNGVTFGLKALIKLRQTTGNRHHMTVLRQKVGKLSPQDALIFKKDYFGHGRSLCIMLRIVAERT